MTPETASKPAESFSTIRRARIALARLRLYCGPLGRQAARFGRWLEDDILLSARQDNADAVLIETDGTGGLRAMRPGDHERLPDSIGNMPDLCALLDTAGIRALSVDVRLESNQIGDLIALLSAFRRRLANRNASRQRGKRRGVLSANGEAHYNCMRLQRRGDTLSVEYSYCATRLSMAVRWFERRHRRFADHRAIFHAAPRFGLVGAALPAVAIVGYLLTRSLVFLVAASAVQAVILFVAIYVFMRGIGSVEYDNEESAYRLGRANATLTQYANRIRHDLALARTVQQQLLPATTQMPQAGRIEWASRFVPETEVGGDYFDAVPMGGGRVGLVFADVSGHGMAAALITVIVKMAFQEWAEKQGPLEAFIQCVNRDLCRYTPEGSFVVLVAALLDTESRRLQYANCGHSPPPLCVPADPQSPAASLDAIGSMLLGVQETIAIETAACPLGPGDTVVLATDGLTEARNAQRELYGVQRLIDVLHACRAAPLEELIDALLRDVSIFSGDTAQTDDRTVLAFRLRAPGGRRGNERTGGAAAPCEES